MVNGMGIRKAREMCIRDSELLITDQLDDLQETVGGLIEVIGNGDGTVSCKSSSWSVMSSSCGASCGSTIRTRSVLGIPHTALLFRPAYRQMNKRSSLFGGGEAVQKLHQRDACLLYTSRCV